MKRRHQNEVQNFIGILTAITANDGIEKLKRLKFHQERRYQEELEHKKMKRLHQKYYCQKNERYTAKNNNTISLFLITLHQYFFVFISINILRQTAE